MSEPKSQFKLAFKLSLPIIFAYSVLGMVFGILCTKSGFTWWVAPVMSAFIFGGSVQFVALSMMTEHAHFIPILFATVFIAFRNSFYGLSLLERYQSRWWIKSLLAFLLVDATYAILVANPTKPEHNNIQFCLQVSLLIYFSWFLGTLIGALFSSWIPPFPAFEFILPAFFMVVVVDYFIALKEWHIIIAPIIAIIVAYFIWPSQYLLAAILISIPAILMINHFKRAKA